MSLETCPVCEEEFIPTWENGEIKCKKCKSKIEAKKLGQIEQDRFQDWNKDELIELVNNLISRLESISEEYDELENRIETLGIIVEQNK